MSVTSNNLCACYGSQGRNMNNGPSKISSITISGVCGSIPLSSANCSCGIPTFSRNAAARSRSKPIWHRQWNACSKTIVQLAAPCNVQKVHQVDQNASSMRHQAGDCGFLPVTACHTRQSRSQLNSKAYTYNITHYSRPRKQIVFVHFCPIHNSLPWRDTGIKQKRGVHLGDTWIWNWFGAGQGLEFRSLWRSGHMHLWSSNGFV